jgi:hypothetical protein
LRIRQERAPVYTDDRDRVEVGAGEESVVLAAETRRLLTSNQVIDSSAAAVV